MGICCCKKEAVVEKEDAYEGKVNFSGIEIVFKKGFINKQQSDILVLATDNYGINRSTSVIEQDIVAQSINAEIEQIRGKNNDPLRSGEVIFTQPGLLKNVKEIAHLTVPIWRGGVAEEESQLTQGYLEIFKICEEKKVSSILLTDITSGRFGIPRQIGYKAIISALKTYTTEVRKSNQITKIMFAHKVKSTVTLFEDFFKADIEGKVEEKESGSYENPLQFAVSPEIKIVELHNDQL